MFQEFKPARIVASAIIAAIAIASSLQHAAAEDDPTEIAAATVDEQYSEHKMDVKRLFASRCSWCHHGYGMKRADGPRLAGTSQNRVFNGNSLLTCYHRSISLVVPTNCHPCSSRGLA